jgi:hypothetical protein
LRYISCEFPPDLTASFLVRGLQFSPLALDQYAAGSTRRLMVADATVRNERQPKETSRCPNRFPPSA